MDKVREVKNMAAEENSPGQASKKQKSEKSRSVSSPASLAMATSSSMNGVNKAAAFSPPSTGFGSLISTSEAQNTSVELNWSAAGLKRVVNDTSSDRKKGIEGGLPSTADLCENDVYSNASGWFHQCSKGWKTWIVGDQELARLQLENKRLVSPWLPLIMISIYLRGIGQTLMVNNVISGFLIMASFSLEQSIGTWVGFSCSLMVSLGIYTSKSEVEGIKLKKWIHQGWTTSPAIWLAHHLVTHACINRSVVNIMPNIVLLSIVCTFIQISLLIHFSRLNFHPMHLAHFLSSSLAFGLFADPDQQCYRLSSSSALIHDFKMPVFWESSHDNDASSIFHTRSPSPLLPTGPASPLLLSPWTSTGNEKGIDAQSDNSLTPWPSEVISQTLRGWCSLYECKPGKSIFAVISHIIAALLFSPWTFLDGCIGAIVAQSAGWALGSPMSADIAANGILTSIAVNFFVLLSVWSRLASLIASAMVSLFTIAIQNAVDHEEHHLKWRCLVSLPFYLSSMIVLLSLSSNRGLCQRVDVAELSHPGMHKRLFRCGNAVDDEEALVFAD